MAATGALAADIASAMNNSAARVSMTPPGTEAKRVLRRGGEQNRNGSRTEDNEFARSHLHFRGHSHCVKIRLAIRRHDAKSSSGGRPHSGTRFFGQLPDVACPNQ